MISTPAPTASEPAPTARRQGRRAWLTLAPWLLAALLLVSQVATVVSERAHAAAYGVVATVLSMAGRAVADAVLAHSPTKARTHAVEAATRRLQAERVALETTMRTIQRDRDAVVAGKAALTREHAALQAAAARRAAAVRALANRTASVLAARSAEAVSTLPVRAAPYLGLVALVAFTTQELKSDCDLAKALASLNAEHGNAAVDTGAVCAAVDRVPTPQQAWSSVKVGSGMAWRAAYDSIEAVARQRGIGLGAGAGK